MVDYHDANNREHSPGITPAQFCQRYPYLYHMATLGSWPGMQRLGLLSTSSLLDLFAVTGRERERIEAERRPDLVRLDHPVHGSVVIRDQKPMDDSGLRRSLKDGLSPTDWYRILNRHVFFWVSEARLRELLAARAYRSGRHTVLIVETHALLHRHGENVRLSPMNSGATKPMPFPRGLDTFLPLNEFPFARWLAFRKGRSPVVEVAVREGIPDISAFTVAVLEMGAGGPDEVIAGTLPSGWSTKT